MLGYHIYENDNQKYKDRYGCGICELISRNPAQISPCGHRFCESCITGYKRKNTTKSKTLKCPLDDEPVEQIFPDKFAEREILGLFVACDGTDDGCSWKGEIREIEAHQDKCRLRPVPCDNKGCKKKVALQFLEKHREQCEHRLTRCPHCGKQLTHKHLKEHSGACEKSQVQCNECKKWMNTNKLSEHQDRSSGDCDELQSVCIFQTIGCSHTKIMKKQEKRKHFDAAVVPHTTLLLKKCIELEDGVTPFIQRTFKEKDIVTEDKTGTELTLSLKMSEILELQEIASSGVENVEKQFENLSITSKKSRKKSSTKKRKQNNTNPKDFTKNIEPVSSDRSADSMMALQSQFDKTLHDTEIANQNICGIIAVTDALRDSNRGLERIVQQMYEEISLKDSTMAEMNERIDILEAVTFNGTLIWPIKNFHEQRYRAITGKKYYILSPVFCTSLYGYKMQLRLYLNGDGIGKGTHISIFFSILRGRYDALLPWPFRQRITLLILDQDNVEHVVDSFNPDLSSPSFQRPKMDTYRNVAAGCPLFLPLNSLDKRAYVKDDTMYVKAVVSTDGLNAP